MPLADAVRRGYIQGSSEEIRNAITSYYEKMKMANIKKAIMEYSTTKVYNSINYFDKFCSVIFYFTKRIQLNLLCVV